MKKLLVTVVPIALLLLAPAGLTLAQQGVAVSIRNGPTDPGLCRPSSLNVFINTTSNALKLCTATDTWTPILSSGGGTFTGPVLLPDGTAAAPSAAFSSDADGSGTGIFRSAANSFSIATNGTSWLTIDSAGVLTHTGTATFSSPSTIPFTASRTAATTGAAVTVAAFEYLTTGTATADIGAGVQLKAEDGAGNSQEYVRLIGGASTVTDAAENGYLQVGITVAGTANTEKFRVDTLGATVRAGTAVTRVRIGGTLCSSSTSTGNVGAGEDDLITCSLAANSLATNLDSLDLVAAGTFAANGNNKRIRVRSVEGANNVVLLDTTALGFNGADWSVRCTFARTASTTFKSTCSVSTSSALLVSTTDYVTGTFTFANAGTIKLTGEATADNDVVEELARTEWKGAP